MLAYSLCWPCFSILFYRRNSSRREYLFSRSSHSCPAYLDHFTSQLVVASEHRPACAVRLYERHLKLGTQDSEFTLFWLDGSVQWEFGLVSFAIGRAKIEIDMIGLEVNNRLCLVDLLEVERSGDGGCGLVEVMSVMLSVPGCGLYCVCVDLPNNVNLLLLAIFLRLSYEQMSVFCFAALHSHELVEL